MIFATVVIAVWGTLFALLIVLSVRNQKVANDRGKMLDEIQHASLDDIANRKEWYWRYEAYDQVSYYKQALMFWKPLRSFWNDLSFLDAAEKQEYL